MTFDAEANRRAVFAEIALVEAMIEGLATDGAAGEVDAARAALTGDSTLDHLARAFQLSPFERAILAVCAGMELREETAAACEKAAGSPFPTYRMLLARFGETAHFTAFAPQRPLREYQLVTQRAGDDLMTGRLRIDERLLHFVLGVATTDPALRGVVEPIESPPLELVPESYTTTITRIGEAWLARTPRPIVQLTGPDPIAKLAILGEACRQIGAGLVRARATDLPAHPRERDELVRLCQRETLLHPAALVIELDEHDPPEATRAAVAFVERVGGLLAMIARDAVALPHRRSLTLEIPALESTDQRRVWQHELGLAAEVVDAELGAVMGQFRLGLSSLQQAAEEIREALAGPSPAPLERLAWRACRRQVRPHLDSLAQRIDTRVTWDDLVLPAPKLAVLRNLTAHVRHTRTVYDHWGFSERGERGLGITALFAGASGTGKTMAAEVIAKELELDLYKIDLSQLISKYIGETEKNLRRIFDAAEQCGALLLFDEADALFGKRSEVKDSHDRYANLEVSYLLQRMEQYRGLAILTTNMRRSLDHAFLRRLRFVVEFPFPDAGHRAEIWRRAFPAATPLGVLDHTRLARLNISGGIIRSIAVNAAFLAADAGEPIGMHHLEHAVREEYAKLEKPYEGAL